MYTIFFFPKYISVDYFFSNFYIKECLSTKGFPGGSDSKESSYTMQETQVRSLGQEDSLEKGMATHSSILA